MAGNIAEGNGEGGSVRWRERCLGSKDNLHGVGKGGDIGRRLKREFSFRI